MLKNLSKSEKILVGVGCIIFAGILLFCLWFFNGIYYDTPLEAVDAERDSNTLYTGDYLSDELFTVRELICIEVVEETAEVIYISKADTFSVATCIYSDLRGKWFYEGIWSTQDLENDDDTFIYRKGNSLEYVGVRRGNTVWGIKLADGSALYVNGEKTIVKKYDFEFQGQNKEIEFWYAENITNDDYTVEAR